MPSPTPHLKFLLHISIPNILIIKILAFGFVLFMTLEGDKERTYKIEYQYIVTYDMMIDERKKR